MNKPPHNNAAKDTAEAQVAGLVEFAQKFVGGYPDCRKFEAEKLLASLPDSAAKLQAVVAAAEKLRECDVDKLGEGFHRALLELHDAVAAYKESRTGEDKA
jgi:hypothetical protein